MVDWLAIESNRVRCRQIRSSFVYPIYLPVLILVNKNKNIFLFDFIAYLDACVWSFDGDLLAT